MIDSKLAIELKEAGFPQEGIEWYCPFCTYTWNNGGIEGGFCNIEECKGWEDKYTKKDPKGKIYDEAQVSIPTLSVLIEACGDDFGTLHKRRTTGTWSAVSSNGRLVLGSIIEEAVAKLWLKLNEK